MTEEDIIRARVQKSLDETAFNYCDHMCTVSKLECGSKYGDTSKCKILQRMFHDMFEESDRMHE